jgi:hypothetical protein
VACPLKEVGGSVGQYLKVPKLIWAWLALQTKKRAKPNRKILPAFRMVLS